jgi:hypothetical protein
MSDDVRSNMLKPFLMDPDYMLFLIDDYCRSIKLFYFFVMLFCIYFVLAPFYLLISFLTELLTEFGYDIFDLLVDFAAVM